MVGMEKHLLFLSFLLLFSFVHPRFASAEGTNDRSEQWGYVEVRPGAHLFWWLYRSSYRVEDPSKPWPVLLWLQGGPDSPVATGFSYVEDESLVVKTDYEAAADLTTLLIELFNGNETLQKSPLYIFAESYGGKFASALGLTALEAIEAGKLKAQLGGVALGDSWISPEDYVVCDLQPLKDLFVLHNEDSHFCLVTHCCICTIMKFSWGPVLKVMSRIDENGLNQSNSLALKIQQQLAEGKLENATATWSDLERVILLYSNNVDFYNFLLDYESNSAAVTESRIRSNRYIERTSTGAGAANGGLGNLMNGPIRKKLKIIPVNVTWQGQGSLVSAAFVGDFMKPRIEEVDKLLAKGVNVTVYNGQLDLICATKGTEAWLNKLKWDGLSSFLSEDRVPLHCGKGFTGTKGFVRSYRNLFFYWILGAGHMVPIDQPCISLQMVGSITQSPSKS
ncbi:hypothetical protein ACJRO7_008118 [Eucalyptus globulus]|uniref:Carboxypeptidase n=1 Tax=Eucalyptus globulus TaxID=34317 RepID=A0ABD3IQT2_EUCGL